MSMSMATIGLLVCIGAVGLIMAQAIRRLEQILAEAVANQHRAVQRISQLEQEVSSLKTIRQT